MVRAPYFILFCALLCSCSTNLLRLPASSRSTYDGERVRLLQDLAKQGILFQIDDDVVKDVPRAEISEYCNYADDVSWGDQFFNILKVFDRNPALYKKIHVIHLRRGDTPTVEISREWDKAAYLILSYQKVQKREANSDDWRRKCESFGEQRDQVTLTQMQWPSHDDISNFLMKQPDKEEVPRFTFDTRILSHLAQRLSIFKLTPSLAAEKSLHEVVILPEVLNRLSEEVRIEKGKSVQRFEAVDYWLSEIDRGSRLGKHLKFFTVLQAQSLARGIGVDGAERNLASTLNQQFATTYLYISYRSRGGEYQYSSLNDLNRCLDAFKPPGHFSTKPEKFMYPGHNCGQD
jgi:hypothetical protein